MPYDTDNRSGITQTASESRVIATESHKRFGITQTASESQSGKKEKIIRGIKF